MSYSINFHIIVAACIVAACIGAACIGAACVGAVTWYSRGPVQQSPPEAYERCVKAHMQNGEEIAFLSQLVVQIASLVSPDGRNLLSQENHACGSLLPVPDGKDAGNLRRSQRRQRECSPCRKNLLPLHLKQASEEARRPLKCSKCSENHPAVYFPHRQRGHRQSETRTCISRQGRLRICSHKFLTWSDIENFGCKTLRLNCCGRKGHNGHLALLEVRTVDAADGAKRITVAIHTSSDIFQQDSWIPGTLNLPSPKTVSDAIAQSEKDGVAAGLCPHVSFDPKKWQMQLQPQVNSGSCDISLIQDTGWEHFSDQRLDVENLCPLCAMKTTNDASAIKSKSPLATHHDGCCQCSARYCWTWCSTRSFGCGSHSLKLKTTRKFTVSKPTDPEWLRNLEIQSRDGTDPHGDRETKHLLWCDDDPGAFVDWDDVAEWAHSWKEL